MITDYDTSPLCTNKITIFFGGLFYFNLFVSHTPVNAVLFKSTPNSKTGQVLNFALGGALQFASGRGHSNHGTLQRASAKAQGTTAIAVCAVGSFEAC